MNHSPKHLTLSVAVALALAGCGENEPNRVASYQFMLVAQASDTTVDRVRTHDCLVHGFFDLTRPVPPSGTVRFPVQVFRNLQEISGTHIELTAADTTIAEVVMDYVGLGEESLQFTLGVGPYTATLGPGSLSNAEYTGVWTCSPEIPLAQDSTLLAYGYDADLAIVGTWRVFGISDLRLNRRQGGPDAHPLSGSRLRQHRCVLYRTRHRTGRGDHRRRSFDLHHRGA